MIARIAVSVVIACLALPAYAQEASPPAAVPAEPVTALPTLPTAASPLAAPVAESAAPAVSTAAPPAAAQTGYFPTLPPSRPCTAGDIKGMWKLQQLFEVPYGQETNDFGANPFQYLLFNADGTYAVYKNNQQLDSIGVIYERIRTPQEGAPLLQYLLHESGIMFFYQDSQATRSLACFIVANPRDLFTTGQMLLMPTANEAQTTGTRMVKVYQPVMGQAAVAVSDPNQPPQKIMVNKNNKKKKKKKRKQNRNRAEE